VDSEPSPELTVPTVDGRKRDERPELARGSIVARYIIAEALARGGMGVVYKAFDPELSRPVAVKLLKADNQPGGTFRDRLLREAQALARLSHPNVIAVHDVGTFGDDVFIAMEFVEGMSLRRWLEAARRSWREIVEVFLAAGEGLAAAHRANLVHRDFKPDNVMVGADGRVRVLDFGLARLTGEGSGANAATEPSSPSAEPVHDTAAEIPSAKVMRPLRAPQPDVPAPSSDSLSSSSNGGYALMTPLTLAGAVLGTPKFMAPEQHLGEIADERADQFSFCVALHYALYGQFPFAGNTFEEYGANVVRGRILEPPATARVPRWLRSVLLRGLESEPADRYPSMAALLVELRKDPARALQRAALVFLAVAATAGLVVLGGYAAHTRRVAVQRAQLAHEFGQEVAQMASLARIAELAPLHDLRPEMEEIRARMRAIEQHVDEFGDVAVGPGRYALGRGYLALERWEDAARELNQAYATGYRSAQLAYSLGLAEGQLYQRALARLKKSDDATLNAAQRADLARRYRDPALRHLNEARGSLDRSTATPEYVKGLIALYEQRFDDALALAAQAHTRSPALFEAQTLEGDIYQAMANERHLAGNDDGAMEALARAGEAYAKASEFARSSPQSLGGLCRRWVKAAAFQYLRPVSPEASVQRALEACGAALRASPEDAELLAELADAWSSRAHWQADHDTDPGKAFSEAAAFAERAVRLAPSEVYPRQLLVFIHGSIGQHRYLTGGDAAESLDRAILHARRALELDPTSLSVLTLLPNIYVYRAFDEEKHGHDASASLASSVEIAERMRSIYPRSPMAFHAVESAYLSKAQWQLDHGIDPRDSLERGSAACRAEIRVLPRPFDGQVNLCYSGGMLGAHLLQQGLDARPVLDEAAAACRSAIAMSEDEFISHLNLAVVYNVFAELAFSRSEDPDPAIEQSRAEARRSLQLNANAVTLWTIVDTEVLAARSALKRGRDPSAALRAADEAAHRALATDSKNGDALRELAVIARWRGEWLLARHRPVDAVVREGLARVAESLAIQPNMAAGLAAEADLHMIAARGARQAVDRIAAASKARAAIERALQINRFLEHDLRPLLDEAARLAAAR
jgi:serine/threonine protein kinase/tetratricopeptide (TPR) repeat protein